MSSSFTSSFLLLRPLLSRLLLKPHLYLVLICLPFFALGADEENPTEEQEAAAQAANIAPDIAAESEGENGERDGEQNETKGKDDTEEVQLSRSMPNVSLKRAEALLHHMRLMNREDEVVTITSPEENYYGLYLPQATSSPQGAVLILHDQQQHGHWPEVIGPLRDYLPQFGWSTLTIELPDSPKRRRLPRDAAESESKPSESSDEGVEAENTDLAQEENTSDDATEETDKIEKMDNQGPDTESAENINAQNDEQVDEDAEPALPRLQKLPDLETEQAESIAPEIATVNEIEDFQKQNRQRVGSAIAYLQSKNQYNLVLIGYGRGAAWAIDFIHQQISQEEEPKGLTLITIDALPDYYQNSLMNEQLTDITVPYLDLLQHAEFGRARDAKKRLAIMRRNNNKKYRQITTQAISSYRETENPTSRRIRGWVMRNAGGTQIAVKP